MFFFFWGEFIYFSSKLSCGIEAGPSLGLCAHRASNFFGLVYIFWPKSYVCIAQNGVCICWTSWYRLTPRPHRASSFLWGASGLAWAPWWAESWGLNREGIGFLLGENGLSQGCMRPEIDTEWNFGPGGWIFGPEWKSNEGQLGLLDSNWNGVWMWLSGTI